MLKRIGALFDPLGFLSPFTIRAKMCMQEIWFTGIDWDELLPEDIAKRFNVQFSELEELQSIKVPRCFQQRRNSVKNVLHTFVDASQHAYGAVVCMREEYEDQTVSVRLVAANCSTPVHKY